MKIYPWPGEGLSKAMDRVTLALVNGKPLGSVIVKTEVDADIVFLHVIGYPETVEAVKRLRAANKRYVIIQYCLRTTQEPEVHAWLPLWQGAELVWSYYDLHAAIEHDFGHDAAEQKRSFNFYRSPLGVDTSVFRPWPSIPKSFTMMTTGYVAESECVKEVAEAVKQVNGRQWHLGPDLGVGAHSRVGINDQLLAQAYASCSYVAGLRRGEGFELPALEGLMCGARPICFDAPHYRDWFGEFAEYIPEGKPEEVVSSLVELFNKPYRAVTSDEQAQAARLFNWERITNGFWEALKRTQSVGGSATVRVSSQKRRLLWVGDAAVSSGFAKCTHKTLDSPAIQEKWDVHVLGLNYMGDPHAHKYPIYPCITVHGGDLYGVRRLPTLIEKIVPDVVIVQNDPWNLPAYMKAAGNTPVVASLAVDGLNCKGKGLNGLKLAIFWTKFGYEQARRGGYTGDAAVIPLGVDAEFYTPGESKQLSRRLLGLGRATDGWIVGSVNRNQLRKRLDLTIAYFAEWIKTRNVRDAYLYLHVAPTGDQGYDLFDLAAYYGISNRLICADPEIGQGVSEETLRETYRAFDVSVNTSQGEGWSLPTMEAMACGVPSVVPDWAALGEWPNDAVLKVQCSTTAVTPGGPNVIGAIPDREEFIEALDRLYRDRALYETLSMRGLSLVRQPEFDWNEIGQSFANVLDEILSEHPTAELVRG